MSNRFKENILTSLDEFSRHGDSNSDHKDGWGIAFYEEGDVNLIPVNRSLQVQVLIWNSSIIVNSTVKLLFVISVKLNRAK